MHIFAVTRQRAVRSLCQDTRGQAMTEYIVVVAAGIILLVVAWGVRTALLSCQNGFCERVPILTTIISMKNCHRLQHPSL